MKKNLPMLAAAGAFIFTGAAVADFDGVEVDVIGVGASGNLVTHLYATSSDGSGTLLSTGFADINAQNTTFYQDGFGNDFAPNAAFFPLAPNLVDDTFVTFNRLTSTDDTTGGDPDFSMSDTNISGGWFWIPGNGQGNADGTGRVLVAQITLTSDNADEGYGGTVTFFTSGGNPDGVKVDFTFIQDVPAPGALALLGLAGLAGTRRRRG